MYERHHQNSQSAISGLIWILWSDENTFCAQRKQNIDFIELFLLCNTSCKRIHEFTSRPRRMRSDERKHSAFQVLCLYTGLYVSRPRCMRRAWSEACFVCTHASWSARELMNALAGHFSGSWQWYLLGSQWDSHKPPGFHPKYLKFCSEDEQSFYGFGTTWVINDKILILGWSNPLRLWQSGTTVSSFLRPFRPTHNAKTWLKFSLISFPQGLTFKLEANIGQKYYKKSDTLLERIY